MTARPALSTHDAQTAFGVTFANIRASNGGRLA